MANRRNYQNERQTYRHDGDYSPKQCEQFQSERAHQAGDMPIGYAEDMDDRYIPRGSSQRFGSDTRSYRDNSEQLRRTQARQQSDYDPLGYYDAPSRNQPGSHSTFTSNLFGGESYSTPMGNAGAGKGTFFDPSTDFGRRRSYRDSHERGFFERAGDEIASWFGDDDAERRREVDHRGRGPANYTRSNERLLEDACERLTHDRGVDARNINVSAADNEVTLDGTVNTRWEKRRAEDCIHDISGVKHVQNNLRIAETDMRAGTSAAEISQS